MFFIKLAATILFGFIVQHIKSEAYEKCTPHDCAGKLACATIYQHRKYGGSYQCLTFKDEECTTLNNWWLDGYMFGFFIMSHVSSVDSHNTCIRLHEYKNCQGFSIEIEPGDKHQSDLQELDFDNTARSVSSCKRMPNNPTCHVQVLFSKHIKPNEVSEGIDNILRAVDGLASFLASSFKSVNPALGLFFNALKSVIGLFDSKKSIDVKIEEKFVRNSAIEFSAKMHVIQNRLQSILLPSTTPDLRQIDLKLALHTCEEIQQLFKNNNYSFSANKLIASPYLVSFSSVYLAIAKLSYVMRPDMQSSVANDIDELRELNELYLKQAKLQRKDMVETSLLTMVINDKLVCDYGGHSGELCRYRQCTSWSVCKKCLKSIKKSIDKEMENFFRPVINKLSNFS